MESISLCVGLINPEISEGNAEIRQLLRKSIDDLDLLGLGNVFIDAQNTKIWEDQQTRNELFAHCFFNLFCRPFSRIGEHENDEWVWPDVASAGSVALLELVLAAGANPKFSDSRGLTCLHWLAQRSDHEADLEKVMAILVNAGCNLEARDGMYGASPLAWAAYQG